MRVFLLLLFAYPDLGILNYFADRPHITRFILPIMAAAREEWSVEIFQSIDANRPRIVVLGRGLSTLARETQHRGEYIPTRDLGADPRRVEGRGRTFPPLRVTG